MIKFSHAILDEKLSPNALKVYCYLLTCSRNQTAVVRSQRIADICHISRATVFNALKELNEHALVKKAHRYYDGHYISNEYHLSVLFGRWSAVHSTQTIFSLSGSVFSVYLYLCCCRNRKQRAFPSLRQIAAKVGICKTTVLHAIAFLTETRLLIKAAYRAGKHNLYMVLSNITHIEGKKERASALPGISSYSTKSGYHSLFCAFILSFFSVFVKEFSAILDKVGHFLVNTPYPPQLPERKERRTLYQVLNNIHKRTKGEV